MAGILPPLIRTQQPQQATGISAYWRGKGLVFVHNPSLGEVNLADNRGAINTTGFPSDVGIEGRRINAAGASKSEFTDNGLASSGNSLTLISIWRSKDSQYASGDATRFFLSTRTAGNAGWGWGRISAIAGGATGNLTGQTFVLNGVAQYSEANITIESFVDTVVAIRVNGTTASWFRFGKKSSTDTTVGTASTGATTVFGAGGPYSGAGNIWNDRAYLTLAFNKPLSDADIFALCKDVNSPWQIFAPRETRIFVPVSAGGPTAYTLDSQPGSVAVVGSATTLKHARKLSASPGAVSIVGASATFKATRKLNAAAGSVAISGATAELTYTPVGASPVLNAEPGSITIAGATATLKATRKLAADAGSITISGAAATLVKSTAGLTLNAQPGSVTIAGAAAEYRRTYKLEASSAGITIVGASAQLVYAGATGPTTRAPDGAGPSIIKAGTIRPQQSATSRPSNTGGRRH